MPTDDKTTVPTCRGCKNPVWRCTCPWTVQDDKPATQTTLERRLRDALSQLLAEVLQAGFESATDYNWPTAIKDAREALIAASIANREAARAK